MANQKNSPAEVQHAIKQGAITQEYKADSQKIIQALNGLRSTEIMSYLQYMQHQYMAVSLLSPGMKTEFEAHATQELDHANRLADRVQQLGGVPVYDPKKFLHERRMSVSRRKTRPRWRKWWPRICWWKDNRWKYIRD